MDGTVMSLVRLYSQGATVVCFVMKKEKPGRHLQTEYASIFARMVDNITR